MGKLFGLIGAAGYIAPRHMKAIKDIGGRLIAALDPCDSVGIIDSYFPQSYFFVELEEFGNYIDSLRRKGRGLSFISICSPTHLHDLHIRFSLRSGCDVICEKPLVLNLEKIHELKGLEKNTGKKIYSILQLRLHPSIIALKEKVKKRLLEDPGKVYDIDLTYITSRGQWYFISWKGDEKKSGGIVTNIGIHFYDIFSWIFGELKDNILHIRTPYTSAGILKFKNANVRWFLSVIYDHLPSKVKQQGKRSYRSIIIDGEEIEFSENGLDLFTRSYEEIINGNGFDIDDAKKALDIVEYIRIHNSIGVKGDYHPFCKRVDL